MSLRNFLNEHLLLPASDLIGGQRVAHYMRFLHRSRQWSTEQLRSFQLQRLRHLLQYASERVPFYREWFSQSGMQPDDFRSLGDLRQLPIVSKALMREVSVEQFWADGYSARQRLTCRSSGSTGQPFTYYTTREAYSINQASKILSWYDHGYRLGDPYMKIANSQRSSRLKRWQDILNNCEYIHFDSLDDASLCAILQKINKAKPSVIRSYPSPLFLLACYEQQHGVLKHRPHHIMTTGAALTAAYRDVIESVFQCEVVDAYSCEGTPNTYELSPRGGYRTEELYAIAELLDEKGNPISEGTARIVSTDLWNSAMPFLRYDTGDIAELRSGRIIRIVGRECETILNVNGKKITTNNLDKYFAHLSPAVLAYRMVHHQDDSVTLQLEVGASFTDALLSQLRSYWSALLLQPVNIEILEHLPLMHNNKYLTIINE